MNESGDAAGPGARRAARPARERVAIHDEIDLPFGEIRAKLGGGVAGHNGLKSLKRGLGSTDFWRLRVGVGRPDSTDPEIVSAYVLGRFSEPAEEVRDLIDEAADETERLIEQIAGEAEDLIGEVIADERHYEVDETASRCCGSTAPSPATRSTRRCSRSCSSTWRAPATTTRCACW